IKFIYFEFNDISPRRDTSGGALEPIDQLIRPHGYRFIATYNDFVVPDAELFLVSNALYALRRHGINFGSATAIAPPTCQTGTSIALVERLRTYGTAARDGQGDDGEFC